MLTVKDSSELTTLIESRLECVYEIRTEFAPPLSVLILFTMLIAYLVCIYEHL